MKRDQLPPSLTFLLLSRLRKGGFLISSVRYPTPPPLRYSRRCSYAPRLRSLYRPTRSIVRCYSPLLESSLYRCRANLPTYLPIYPPASDHLPTTPCTSFSFVSARYRLRRCFVRRSSHKWCTLLLAIGIIAARLCQHGPHTVSLPSNNI